MESGAEILTFPAAYPTALTPAQTGLVTRIRSTNEWRAFSKGDIPRVGKLPEDIPASPHKAYNNKGWKSWGDWLGTGTLSLRQRTYRPFSEGRVFAQNLKLNSTNDWRAFCKGEVPRLGQLPADIPACPNKTYAGKGWRSMGDWLGTSTVAPYLRNYRPFREARTFARNLKLKGTAEWFIFCKGETPRLGRLPADIPTKPDNSYADKGWKNWGDWLGTGNVAPYLKEFRPFGEARAFVQKLKLKGEPEWRLFCKGEMPLLGRLPQDIPTNPNRTYANKGWKSMGDWLGTVRKRRASISRPG